jgi:hypothetical protein
LLRGKPNFRIIAEIQKLGMLASGTPGSKEICHTTFLGISFANHLSLRAIGFTLLSNVICRCVCYRGDDKFRARRKRILHLVDIKSCQLLPPAKTFEGFKSSLCATWFK